MKKQHKIRCRICKVELAALRYATSTNENSSDTHLVNEKNSDELEQNRNFTLVVSFSRRKLGFMQERPESARFRV